MTARYVPVRRAPQIRKCPLCGSGRQLGEHMAMHLRVAHGWAQPGTIAKLAKQEPAA